MIPSAAVRCYILAGGRSSRMGRDKASLPWIGGSLLRHMVVRAREVFEDVAVVGKERDRLPPDLPETTRFVADSPQLTAALIPGQSTTIAQVAAPVLGILAALADLTSQPLLPPGEQKAFVLATDLPCIERPLLDYLKGRAAAATGAFLVMPNWRGHSQPTCAAYDVRLEPLLTERVKRGEMRLYPLSETIPIVSVPDKDVRRHVESGVDPFANMNAPADYESLLARQRAARDATARGSSEARGSSDD